MEEYRKFSRAHVVRTLMDAAGAKIKVYEMCTSSNGCVLTKTPRVVNASTYSCDTDRAAYMEPNKFDFSVGAVTITEQFVDGVGAVPTEIIITHANGAVESRAYMIEVDTESDCYDGPRVRAAIASLAVIDKVDNEHAGYLLKKAEPKIAARIKIRRGSTTATPYMDYRQDNVSVAEYLKRISTRPDSDGLTGVLGTIKRYETSMWGFGHFPTTMTIWESSEATPMIAAPIGCRYINNYTDIEYDIDIISGFELETESDAPVCFS